MSNLYTITLQSVVNFASTHADLLPLAGVGGYTDEPALSICNHVLSDLLFSQIDFKFNRVAAPMMVTAINKQDYIIAGAVAFTLGTTSTGAHIGLASNSAISESGTTVTVTTLEPHRFAVGDTVYMSGNTVAAYNSTLTNDGNSALWSGGWSVVTVPTTKTFTFTHASSGLAVSGAPGITDYGWLSSANMVNMNDTSPTLDIRLLQAERELTAWSKAANPEKVCVLKDNGDGTLTVRFWYVPSTTVWGVYLIYQAKPPLKTSLADNWSPFPDHYSSLIRQAVLAQMYRYLNSPQQNVEFQKLQMEIGKASGAEEREQTDTHLVPEEGLLDVGSWFGW